MRIYKNWTLKEEQKLETLCQSGKFDFKKIGTQLGRSATSCQSHAVALKISNTFKYRKYDLNENFWNTFNSINCYFAGFSTADANIEFRAPNQYIYRLEISKRDINTLEILKNSINYSGPIRDCLSETGTTSYITVSNTQWGQDLQTNFNIVPNKAAIISAPNTNNLFFLFCWLIGYIDGDGTINYNPLSDQIGIECTSINPKILQWILDFIAKYFNHNVRRYKTNNVRKFPKSNAYRISIAGIKACVIFDYLRQYPVPKLSRKWDKPEILNYINQQKQKFPELFILHSDLQCIFEEKQSHITVN